MMSSFERPGLPFFWRWFRRVQLPVGVLFVLLQRTPAVRWLVPAGESAFTLRAGELLRSAVSLAALGALHSRAGATSFIISPASPIRGTVGSPVDVAFTYTGTPSSPARFQVSGSLPPGLRFVPAAVGGTISSGTPAIVGTPTQAGTFSVQVQGFNPEGLTNGVLQDITFIITGGSVATAPTISSQPQSQTATAGGSVTFSVTAGGSPAPTFQWTRNGADLAGATAAALVLSNVQAADAGTYAVVVRNSAGSVTSSPATLTVTPAGGGGGGGTLAITRHPSSHRVGHGSTVVFQVGAAGATGFQWRRNGAVLPGATGATLVISGASAAQAGEYSAVVNGAEGAATSNAASLEVAPDPDVGRLVNLSILTQITGSDPGFTLGTVIGGAGTTGSKPLLVRAAGPALAQLGVSGALPDPRLDVFSGGVVAAANDDWGGNAALSAAFSRVGAFAYAAANSKDAAVFNAAQPAGAYTVQVSGVGGATGSVIAELYDASATGSVGVSTPRLVNVSVLKQIAAGTVLTAGFVVGGGSGGSRTVLIRAIGPTLGAAPFNLEGAMADPKLDLYRGSTVIAASDNWGGDPQLTAVGSAVGAFALGNPASRDAILLVTLEPGSYTAEVSGVGGGGAALVEVYEVP